MVNISSSTSSEADPTEVEPESTASVSQQFRTIPADGAATINNKEEDEGQPPPLRSMSSFRARLRAGRRDPGAPATLFQWETRGHFWSGLEKAAAPKDPSQARTGLAGVLVRAWQRTKVRAKNTATVVRLRPTVLLWPLLLCAVCLAGGIIGVELGAKQFEELNKDDGRAAANEAANSLDLVWSQSLQPLTSLELHVVTSPQLAQLGFRFPNISELLLLEVPQVLSSLLLSPFGVVRAAHTSPQSSESGVGALLGQSLPTLEPPVQFATFQSLILQPYTGSAVPPLTLLASKPILISGVSVNEDWGNGPAPGGQPIANCSAPTCFFEPSQADTGGEAVGTRLWGFTAGLLDLQALTSQPDAGLKRLKELGYLYRLTLRSSDLSTAKVSPLAVVDSKPRIPSGASTVFVPMIVPGTNQSLLLEVYPEPGWSPYWRQPLLAVVVMLSLAVSVMQFAALVLERRHIMFMEAMLPKQVIGVLGTGRTFYQHYDMVTVLYADIVRYSNAPTGMPAWEVVKLLDDVNNIYDSLLDKHGLVKIRRSGEAFMAVGGCPDVGDPVAVAVRVAMCAREMVMATAGFRSSAGQRVQIRLGLHSGPAVAAVLGTHTPRFSLLGDTVDIAYFMESTSTIMGVHVSDTTAELLTIADDPLISLQPRGIIDIKGRGPITTSWLRIDLLAPMGTWNGEHAGGGGDAGASAPNKSSGGGAGARVSQGGSKAAAAAAAAPADIACTADLAVAATLGVRGAPLVRKLSQTGLTQTRRALPDRRQREGRGDVYDNSLLGSFTLRLEPETLTMLRDMLARPTPPPSPSRAKDGRGGNTSADAAASFEIAAPNVLAPPAAVAESSVVSWDAVPTPSNDSVTVTDSRVPDEGPTGAGGEGIRKEVPASLSGGTERESRNTARSTMGAAVGSGAGSGAGAVLRPQEAVDEDQVSRDDKGTRNAAKSGVAAAARLEIQMG